MQVCNQRLQHKLRQARLKGGLVRCRYLVWRHTDPSDQTDCPLDIPLQQPPN